jgi:hypothetical protein
MSDTTKDPQPIDPPVTTGGGGTTPTPAPSDTNDAEPDEGGLVIDPPVSTGGGG